MLAILCFGFGVPFSPNDNYCALPMVALFMHFVDNPVSLVRSVHLPCKQPCGKHFHKTHQYIQ